MTMKQFLPDKQGGVLISVLVGLLTVTVAIQGLLIYRMYHKENSCPSIAAVSAELAAFTASQKRERVAQRSPHSTGPSGNTGISEDPFDLVRLWDRDLDEWDPFQEMERMREQMDQLFQASLNRLRHFGRFPQDKSCAFAPEMDLTDDDAESRGCHKRKMALRCFVWVS